MLAFSTLNCSLCKSPKSSNSTARRRRAFPRRRTRPCLARSRRSTADRTIRRRRAAPYSRPRSLRSSRQRRQVSHMKQVQINAVPSQTLNVVLGGQSCQIALYQKQPIVDEYGVAAGLFFDLIVGGVPILTAVRCLDRTR